MGLLVYVPQGLHFYSTFVQQGGFFIGMQQLKECPMQYWNVVNHIPIENHK